MQQSEKDKLLFSSSNPSKGFHYDLNWLIAIGFVALGIYLFIFKVPFLVNLVGHSILICHIMLFVIAFLLIITCSIGFASISQENNNLLRNFCILMSIVILLQILTASAGVLLHDPAKDWVGQKMRDTIVNEYAKQDIQINESVQQMQSQLKCCGSLKYSDYKESYFTENRKKNPTESEINLQDTNIDIYAVPDSCCIAYSQNCGRLVHPSNIYYRGCLDTIFGKLQSHLFMIFVVLFSLLIVEVLALILGIMFIKSSQEIIKKSH